MVSQYTRDLIRRQAEADALAKASPAANPAQAAPVEDGKPVEAEASEKPKKTDAEKLKKGKK